MKSLACIALSSIVAVLAGCSSAGEVERTGAAPIPALGVSPRELNGPTNSYGAIPTVSAVAARYDANHELGDEPASLAFKGLDGIFASSAAPSLSFKLYELESPDVSAPRLSQRAVEIGMVNAVSQPTDVAGWVLARAGTHRLRLIGVSGAEVYSDLARFHRSPGQATIASHEFYIEASRQYAQSRAKGTIEAFALRPYKLWTYHDAAAGPGQAPVESISQISVAFNAAVDDLPVIGSGGKLVVHLTPAGEVVGHELQLRGTRAVLGTVSGAQIKTPSAARAEIETRLRARGIDLTQYVLTKEHFGYLRRGRSVSQRVLAPHYAFFYEPLPGVRFAKRLVETTTAVLEPNLAALVARDEAEVVDERARKMDGLRDSDPR